MLRHISYDSEAEWFKCERCGTIFTKELVLDLIENNLDYNDTEDFDNEYYERDDDKNADYLNNYLINFEDTITFDRINQPVSFDLGKELLLRGKCIVDIKQLKDLEDTIEELRKKLEG